MVKILKTYIYDIIDIKKEEEINSNDIDIDDQIIDDENDGLNILIEEEEYIINNDIEYIINNDIEFDEDDNKEKKILEKKTFNYLTKYEQCFILGIRIQQIMNDSPIFINIQDLDVVNPFNIAYEELIQKKIPFKIKRKLPNGNVEIWDLNDLIIL